MSAALMNARRWLDDTGRADVLVFEVEPQHADGIDAP